MQLPQRVATFLSPFTTVKFSSLPLSPNAYLLHESCTSLSRISSRWSRASLRRCFSPVAPRVTGILRRQGRVTSDICQLCASTLEPFDLPVHKEFDTVVQVPSSADWERTRKRTENVRPPCPSAMPVCLSCYPLTLLTDVVNTKPKWGAAITKTLPRPRFGWYIFNLCSRRIGFLCFFTNQLRRLSGIHTIVAVIFLAGSMAQSLNHSTPPPPSGPQSPQGGQPKQRGVDPVVTRG